MWAYAKVSTLLRLRQRPRVFVSYRRRDGGHAAARLADKLKDDFDLFWDLKKIKAGNDFPRVIQQAVEGSHIMLALIGTQWATEVDEFQRRRLDDPADWVAHEIAVGLRRNVVIPVLLDGAHMPERSELPAHIAKLPDRHAMTVRQESFDDDAERLRRTIWEAVAPRWPLRRWAAASLVSALLLAALVLGRAVSSGGLPGDTRSDPTPTVTSASNGLKPGESATFTRHKISVLEIHDDPTYGLLVRARVCVLKAATSSPTTKLSWAAWSVKDRDDAVYEPALADSNSEPPGMYRQTGWYEVGKCASGVIPFAGAPTSRSMIEVIYADKDDCYATWRV